MSSEESCEFNGSTLTLNHDKPLGQGLKSSVFRGSWNGGLVAVKVMSPAASPDILKQKTEQNTSISHPNILRLHGFGSTNSLLLVSPFLHNGNVRQYLNANPSTPRLSILLDIALGMDFLHKRSIIHGSFKSPNVLIQNDGTACITDVGMVEVQPSNNPDAHRYWSPEAWKGTTSRGSDIFAFAMTAFEILTSTTVWGVLSEKHIYQLVVYEDSRPDRPEDDDVCPDHIWNTLEACWGKEARSRPQFDKIVKLLSAEPSQSPPVAPKPAELVRAVADLNIGRDPIGNAGDDHGDEPPPPAYMQEFPTASSSIQPLDVKVRPPAPQTQPQTQQSNTAQFSRSASSSRAGSFEGSRSNSSAGGDRPSRAFHVANATPGWTNAPTMALNVPHRTQQPSQRGNRLTTQSLRNPRASVISTSSQGSSASYASGTTNFTTPQSTPLNGKFPTSISESSEVPGRNSPPRVTVSRSSSLAPVSGLPPGAAAPSQPQVNQWAQNHHLASAPPPNPNLIPPSPPWNGSSRGGSSVTSSTNAVLIAGALQAQIRGGLANVDPRMIDEALIKIQLLATQSDKDAERLVTAGAIPTLIQLLKARVSDGTPLEGVLMTLGMVAHDPISANTIYRTGTTQIFIDILSSTGVSDELCTLCIWNLNRVCRSVDIALGLIKTGLPRVLMHKGLKSKNQLMARMSAYCLGILIQTDAIADTLDMQGIILEIVDYARRISFSLDSSAEDLSQADDICGALYPIARMSRSIKLAKTLNKAGAVPLLANHLNRSEDPQVLDWAARAIGCLMRPNSGDMAKILLEAGTAQGLARLPSVLPTDDVFPLGSFAFAVQRFSCAEWGGSVRKALVEAGVVDSLLAALRTAADEPAPQVHVELALAVSFLGDVGGGAIRKEIVNAGGIDILKRVGARAALEPGKEAQEVAKSCSIAVTSITGNIWTRNAASAKTAMSHNWSGGCPDFFPPCPFNIIDLDTFEV